MISIVVGVLEIMPYGLKKRLEELGINEKIETRQTSVLLRLAKIQSFRKLRRLSVAQLSGKNRRLNLM